MREEVLISKGMDSDEEEEKERFSGRLLLDSTERETAEREEEESSKETDRKSGRKTE
jgi:hypothetical protein